MTGEEVRKMKDEEIKAELGRLRTKLFDLRSQTVTEKVENTAQFTVIRRDVARLLTESSSRQRAKGGASGAGSGVATSVGGGRAKTGAKSGAKSRAKSGK